MAMMGHVRNRLSALLASVILIASCGTTDRSPTAVASSASPAALSSGSPAAASTPVASPADPLLDALVVTVSDRLRVRSLPEVSDESIKYEPLLPLGTELRVIGGPATGSGYVWYEVSLSPTALNDGIAHGWVAMAGKDGEPWIALANAPITGLETAMSAIARAEASPADAASAADAVGAFGLDMYRKMLDAPDRDLQDENVVFSPTSIALALGMTRLGARGETGSEMDGVLQFGSQSALEAGLNALDQALASRDGSYLDDEGKAHELTLRIANASFAQRDWSIEQAYLDAVASVFGAGLNLVDYVADPEQAREVINAWVSQRTANRIPELLEPPDVTDSTRLYLVNAIYLKANWVAPFATGETTQRPFRRLDGSTVTVPTMRLTGNQDVPYLRQDGWRATELRYQGPNHTTPLAMMLIVPDDLAAFENAISAEFLDELGSDLTAERKRLVESVEYPGGNEVACGVYPYSVDLFMPRFSIETRAKLGKLLEAMGMTRAFDPERADFTGIHAPAFPGDNVYIANVIHQANIDVDELGTEAAAATAVGMDTGGCTGPEPAETTELRLDRPFLFAVRDIETGAILFMGRVVDPGIER
jgi:serpin B